VAPTVQAGFNGSGGGGSVLYGQGDGITLRRSTFDEAGYRGSFTIVDNGNVTISGNTFRRSANRSVRTSGESGVTGGPAIKNLTTATLAGTFQFKSQTGSTAAAVSAFNLVVGGPGSDRNLKGTASSDWISLDAGDDRIDAGFGQRRRSLRVRFLPQRRDQ